MKKRGKQHKHKGGGESQNASFRSSLGDSMSFGFKHMILVLAVGIAIGCFMGYEIGYTRASVDAGTLPTDSFGRTLGDPRYGRNFP